MFEKKVDVAVCGGGIAGVSAALASARRGMKTILIEKTILPGGLATSGLVLVYLPLCDGNGRQVISGLAEELLLAANKYGPFEVDPDWREKGRYRVDFSPASMVLSIDELLEKAGVEIWLDTLLTGTSVEEGTLRSVQVVNKSGHGQIFAKVFVDATGDADVAYYAGNQCRTSPNSMVLWSIEHNEKEKGGHDFSFPVHTAIHADPMTKIYTEEPLSGRMVTDFVMEGRRRYRHLLDREYSNGFASRKSHYPLTLQTQPPIRKTRCIQGRFTLMDGMHEMKIDDSVAIFGDWRHHGRVWQLPYGTLLPDNVGGLLAAGRCISALGEAWEAVRVIPVAALSGEVAGTAAALSVKNATLPSDLPCALLAAELQRASLLLHV